MIYRPVRMPLALLALSFCGVSCTTPGNALFSLGSRKLNSDWKPVDSQTLAGLTISLPLEDSLKEIEFGALGSVATVTETDPFFGTEEITGTIAEYFFGSKVALPIEGDSMSLFFGGGLSILLAQASADDGVSKSSQEDNSLGAYVHAGIHRRLGEQFILGLEIRYTAGTNLQLGIETDADGPQFSVLIGWRWPKTSDHGGASRENGERPGRDAQETPVVVEQEEEIDTTEYFEKSEPINRSLATE